MVLQKVISYVGLKKIRLLRDRINSSGEKRKKKKKNHGVYSHKVLYIYKKSWVKLTLGHVSTTCRNYSTHDSLVVLGPSIPSEVCSSRHKLVQTSLNICFLPFPPNPEPAFLILPLIVLTNCVSLYINSF